MIKKLINKLFTLTAFIAAVCLAIHYTPTFLITGNMDSVDNMPFRIIALLFTLLMLVSAVLLLLDLFSLKIKIVQNKVWMFFAAIGVVPILPYASFWLIYFVCFIFHYAKRLWGFLVG